MVSVISTIHVIDFFRLSNPNWLAVTLAIAFEVGAAASLAAIIILDRTSRWLVWALFIIITLMQMMGNMYYAYTHLTDFQSWSELFGINEEEPIFQKRILSLVSGAILPIVALGFIKSLVDYIRPSKDELSEDNITEESIMEESIIEESIEDEKIQIEKETSIDNKPRKKSNSARRALTIYDNIVEDNLMDVDKYPKESPRENPDYRHPSQRT
jgi:hypothetical protein